MPAWLLPALYAGSEIIKGLGAGRGGQTTAAVPRDLRGLRGQNIDLLSQLLQPGAFDMGGFGNNFFFGGLQRQGLGIEQFLNQPSPEMRALDVSRPILEGMLTGTGPQFEADIAKANSMGGRFGSSNAILRGEALRNLYNQRTQTAQTLGVLSQSAGQSQFDRLFQLQNQRLQLLAGLLSMSAGATLGLPVTQGPGAIESIGGAGANISKLLMMLPYLSGGGGGGTTTAGLPTDLS